MNERDERLARIQRQKAEARTTAAEDFAQLNEGLAEAQRQTRGAGSCPASPV